MTQFWNCTRPPGQASEASQTKSAPAHKATESTLGRLASSVTRHKQQPPCPCNNYRSTLKSARSGFSDSPTSEEGLSLPARSHEYLQDGR